MESVPHKCERIAARVVDGRAVVIVLDRGELHTLNEVGTRVWELLDECTSLESIAQVLTREFDVELDRARRDVAGLVEQLTSVGALTKGGTT